jgi:hypothetical protein
MEDVLAHNLHRAACDRLHHRFVLMIVLGGIAKMLYLSALFLAREQSYPCDGAGNLLSGTVNWEILKRWPAIFYPPGRFVHIFFVLLKLL